jgi:hypothetical protein
MSSQPAEFPEHRRDAVREMLTLAAANAPRRRSKRARLVVTAAASLVLVAGGSVVAYSQISSAPVTDNDSARCYTSAVQYRPGDEFPGTTVVRADGSEVASALSVCTDLWRQGFLKLGDPEPVRDTNPLIEHAVPVLVVCTLPDGRAAVFPGPVSCADLGLAAADPTPTG